MAGEIKHTSLSKKTYNKLKDNIISGKFAAGERLSYEQLTNKLAVSQTPLREALQRLEREGLVVNFPRKGVYVRELSETDIVELYDIREMLEALAARLACQFATDNQIAEMTNTCRQYENAISKGDKKLCLEVDLKFHKLLLDAGANNRLKEIMKVFHLQLFGITEPGPDYLNNAKDYLGDHLSIIAAISKHHENLAEKVTRKHIQHGKELILSQMQEMV